MKLLKAYFKDPSIEIDTVLILLWTVGILAWIDLLFHFSWQVYIIAEVPFFIFLFLIVWNHHGSDLAKARLATLLSVKYDTKPTHVFVADDGLAMVDQDKKNRLIFVDCRTGKTEIHEKKRISHDF